MIMKRNMDLIKTILLNIENGEPNKAIQNYSKDEILYNKNLLIEAKLVKGRVAMNTEGSLPKVAEVVLFDLTWEGQNFLDLLKDKKKFELLGDLGKVLSLEALKEVIKQTLRSQMF